MTTPSSPSRLAKKLLPCPFCGSAAEMDTQRAYRALSGGKLGTACAIYCTECSADISICMEDVSGWTVDDAIHHVTEQWNRRASSLTTQAKT